MELERIAVALERIAEVFERYTAHIQTMDQRAYNELVWKGVSGYGEAR